MSQKSFKHREKICSTCKKRRPFHYFIGKGQDFLNCQSCRAMNNEKRKKTRKKLLEEGRAFWDQLN